MKTKSQIKESGMPAVNVPMHSVEQDLAGFAQRLRLTCYTCEKAGISGSTLVLQPYMTTDVWNKLRTEFEEKHPKK